MTTCYVEKFLHIADFFSTGTARGARDKYQVWCQRQKGQSEAGPKVQNLEVGVLYVSYQDIWKAVRGCP